jgi:hypothetical protein
MTTHNTHDYASHFPRRANVRVPNMSYASDVNTEGRFRAELGILVAALATGIVNAQSINTALAKSQAGLVANHRSKMGKYGRNVTVVLSGAGTPAVTVFGLDYLGQPMSENFTGAGTTPQVGKKAFKEVTSITSALVASTTISVGYGTVLGLPFAASKLHTGEEYIDQVATTDAGTFAAAVLTAQTATSGDPRGTYAPHANNVPNGARDITVICQAIEGDYHGLPHFTS